MKKNILILLISVSSIQTLSAQIQEIKAPKVWLDLQLVQHIGLNKWNDVSYANDGLPSTSFTEIRGVVNLYAGNNPFGVFVDMGLGIVPAPPMKSLDLDRMPMPNSGTEYYLREVLSKSGSDKTSVRFKVTGGAFSDFRATKKLCIIPYLGMGISVMPQRHFVAILKEKDSNMQYKSEYLWGENERDDNDEGSKTDALAYLSARLNFNYKISSTSSLLFGLEYAYFFNTMNFYGRYTNTFNGNIQRSITAKGNKINTFGISVGISFK